MEANRPIPRSFLRTKPHVEAELVDSAFVSTHPIPSSAGQEAGKIPLRYWQLVSQPTASLKRVARFLGIAEDQITTVPPDNSRPFVAPGLRTSILGRVIRAGAAAGQLLPPGVWRRASEPLIAALQFRGPRQRPKLGLEQRSALLGDCVDDIELLEEVLRESFQDWRSATGRGSFAGRAELLHRVSRQ